MKGSTKGTVQVPLHPKFKAVQKTPLAGTARGLSGITPAGVTGVGVKTKHGQKGGHSPAMKAGGKNKNHTVPISFSYPQIRSAGSGVRSMSHFGAQPGSMVGINPPFKAGKVSGKRDKRAMKQKGM
jgi:hypothetical protein